MPKNKIEDLRNILFETMERLMDDDEPMDIERAKAVAGVAQVVINTAKVEVDFMKQTGHGGTSFIQSAGMQPRQLASVPQPAAVIGIRPEETDENLCLRCPLPACDENSPQCLIQIKRLAA